MSSLYFNPELEPAVAVVGARVGIRGDEARHAATVSRARVGERIAIGNGSGLIVWGSIVSVHPTETVIDVDDVVFDEPATPELWLVQALAKGDRDELAVQAATELGVTGVIPWAAERSVSRWDGAKVAKGVARWSTIVRESSKQSIRSWIPRVESLHSTADVAKRAGRVLVLDPTSPIRLSEVAVAEDAVVTVVVGPEGGISPKEFANFESVGATRVRLGPEVLRTSTAGPAALAALSFALGRW